MHLGKEGLVKWYTFAQEKDMQALAEALADDVVLHSPVLWKPKVGKAEAMLYLSSVARILEHFTYLRQFHNDQGVMLEFRAHIGPLVVKGVDMIQLNAEGQISDIEVMVRPATGPQALATTMVQQLARASSPRSEP